MPGSNDPDSMVDAPNDHNVADLSDMLDELRILLPSAQLLTGFLVTLPFSAGFAKIVQSEKWVFMATFVCSVTSLVLFSAPAAQHRLMRPLPDRVRFKQFATREILAGSVLLSLALTLGTELVISEVFGHALGIAMTAGVALSIGGLWWLVPGCLRGKWRG